MSVPESDAGVMVESGELITGDELAVGRNVLCACC